MRKRIKGITTLLAAVLACALLAEGLSSPAQSADRPFEEFLAGMEFVAEGTLIDYQQQVRTTLGGCQDTVPARIVCTDYRMQLSEVLAGSTDDSVVVVSVVGPPRHGGALVTPGTKVLLWGIRSCNDGWRLWGGVAGINQRQLLFPVSTSSQALVLGGEDGKRPSSYTQFQSKWTALSGRVGANVINGANGVALVRIDAIEGSTYRYSFLRWLVPGQCTPAPTVLLNPGSDCVKDVAAGDTLMLPVFCNGPGGDQTLNVCPRALRVRYEFLPGLGVPLDFAQYVLSSDINGTLVRPISQDY